MARAATLILGIGLLVSACATPSPQPSPANKASSFPPRAALRAAFEKLGVRFSGHSLGVEILWSKNSNYGSSDRAFSGVEIVGDPVTGVIVNLNSFTADSAGRFPGSALIDVLDSFDPGVKRWFVAQEDDPGRDGASRELDLNGFVAQIPPIRLPMAVIVIKTQPVPAGSD